MSYKKLFHIKKLLSALVLPPFGLILLALYGLWLARRHPRSGRGIAALALLLLAALSFEPVADALMQELETAPPISKQDLGRVQAIVILGGGTYAAPPEYGEDTVSRWTLERVRYGAQLQRQSGLPILVSGGAPFGGRPEGEAMKEAIERDFQGHVRWVENASRDTAENAAFSAIMLKAAGVKRIALVSHAWHLPRAIELCERQGLEVIAAPTAYSTLGPSLYARALPSATWLNQSSMALHEWLGIVVDHLKKALPITG